MWYQGFVNLVFFGLQVIFVLVVISFILILFFSLIEKAKSFSKSDGNLKIKKLNKQYIKNKNKVLEKILTEKEYKKVTKSKKKQNKKEPKKNIFVLNFKADMQASQVASLREEISSVLSVATKKDEIVIRVESPGGVVNGYGLAAAQFDRIRQKGINLVVTVDSAAASGGYMVSVVANKIIASPFAIVGSIGVVGSVPNIRNLLEKKGVEVEMHTSGKYKRTLTTMGENTEEGREKFKQELNRIHELFKSHILKYRPNLDMEKVATGEYWFGQDAFDLGLVDEIGTYDDYIINLFNEENTNVYSVKYEIKPEKKGLLKKILGSVSENDILKTTIM